MIGVNAPKKYPKEPATEKQEKKSSSSLVFTDDNDFEAYSRARWGKKGNN